MQYLNIISKMTEWSLFISKADHSIYSNPSLCLTSNAEGEIQRRLYFFLIAFRLPVYYITHEKPDGRDAQARYVERRGASLTSLSLTLPAPPRVHSLGVPVCYCCHNELLLQSEAKWEKKNHSRCFKQRKFNTGTHYTCGGRNKRLQTKELRRMVWVTKH